MPETTNIFSILEMDIIKPTQFFQGEKKHDDNNAVLSTDALNADPVAAISSNWANHKAAPASTLAH